MTKREKMIKWLIDDDIQNVLTGDMNDWLFNILNTGFSGYANQLTWQLE